MHSIARGGLSFLLGTWQLAASLKSGCCFFAHLYASCCALQCVIAHLENADVARLLRIFQYVQRYEADWEVAWLQAEQKEAEERKNEPMLTDEDMLGG
jgi:hypothetical protein